MFNILVNNLIKVGKIHCFSTRAFNEKRVLYLQRLKIFKSLREKEKFVYSIKVGTYVYNMESYIFILKILKLVYKYLLESKTVGYYTFILKIFNMVYKFILEKDRDKIDIVVSDMKELRIDIYNKIQLIKNSYQNKRFLFVFSCDAVYVNLKVIEEENLSIIIYGNRAILSYECVVFNGSEEDHLKAFNLYYELYNEIIKNLSGLKDLDILKERILFQIYVDKRENRDILMD